MGFYGWGKTRVGKDSIEAQDIVVGRGVYPEVVCKGGGNNKGCDSELSRNSGGGGSRAGVSKGGGVFNGHGGEEEDECRGFLMRETRGAKRVFVLLEEFLGMGKFRFGEPRVFFRGISFPMNQVLSTGRSSFVFHDFLNLVMFLVLKKFWGRRWEVLPMDGVLVIR